MGVPIATSLDSGHAREAAFANTTSHILVRTTAALIALDVFDALARVGSKSLTVQELAEAAMPQKAVNLKNLMYGQVPAVQQSYRPLRELVVEDAVESRGLNGGSLYEFHQKHPASNKHVNQGMDGNSKVHMHAIYLDACQGFQNVSVLVAVGGGFGAWLSAIIDRYPHIKGINFDLPGVIAESPGLPGNS